MNRSGVPSRVAACAGAHGAGGAPDGAGGAPREPGAFVLAVSVFVFRDGRFLAMQRSRRVEAAPGAWDAVSGRVEPGEAPRAAAERECREESGLAVDVDPRPADVYV